MSHPHDHDDGLVHPHNFACRERGRMAERPLVQRPAEDHDDGLVHAHNYACGERGRPIHA
ncbi:hypothetical protein [Rubritepida flocculans]|uniref:hypothetical protein n=1 Tax=Rubritepida flocculans TaxID=182403 RepID=UPI00041D619F|nr:hypothetical protein [Rubritepida flocculans]